MIFLFPVFPPTDSRMEAMQTGGKSAQHDYKDRKKSLEALRTADELYDKIIGSGFAVTFKTKKIHHKKHLGFSGISLSSWLVARCGTTSKEAAIEQCELLLQYKYMVCVKRSDNNLKSSNPSVGFSADEGSFYCWASDEHPHCLNVKRLWDGEARDASEVGDKVRRAMLKTADKYISAEGVDYQGIAKCKSFKKYVTLTWELQQVKLRGLKKEELLAFAINIYNALVIHANIVRGPPKNAVQRAKFFGQVSYLIGGERFSLSDLEHGLLRGNKRPPGRLSKLWGKDDPRFPLAKALTPMDPRIHFALVCGARGCPPVRVYSPANVDKALQRATIAFVASEVIVDMQKRKVTLSRIWSWYMKDFGKNSMEVLKWIVHFTKPDSDLRKLLALDKKIKIKWAIYDWDMNSYEFGEEDVHSSSEEGANKKEKKHK